jgi:RNA polymerase sigma-70 factor (ECF subfamily)
LAEQKLNIFEQLFRGLFRPLCGFAMKYVMDEDEAKNIVHDVFITVWEKFEQLPSDTNYRSYLYTAVRNRSLNYIRDKKKHVVLEKLQEHEPAEINTTLESSELEREIELAIESLPEKCRMVFEMHRFEGFKYAQIAEKMQISVKTVEAQMSKALSILREHLADFLMILFFFIYR